ncbi:YbaY family lipoprotein [Deinococcus planocerae]|uniref:YbaY family lipoprotein n=1 Tax=Deinococcus planocerae TaxID=1737569 RepID=UPI000C7F2332|nr:YbaY family lipoprotein [Deinococcus planocerae]
MRFHLPLLLAALLTPSAPAQMTITRPPPPAASVQPSAAPAVPSDLPAGWRVISGRVRAPAEVRLPAGSTVTVSLEDVTRQEGASLSRVQASFPISRLSTPYQLQFNPVRLRPGRTYALTARVTAPDGRLLYRTTTPQPLPTARNAVQDVAVSAVR